LTPVLSPPAAQVINMPQLASHADKRIKACYYIKQAG
jgi:hypothetical protein